MEELNNGNLSVNLPYEVVAATRCLETRPTSRTRPMSRSSDLRAISEERLEGGFALGDFLVEPRLVRVVRGDDTVSLEPKTMSVLVTLAARAGEVVPREALRAVGWGDSYAAEEGLRRAVMLLRRLFHDDPRSPEFIETIPRVGYRLIAAVEPLAKTGSDDSRSLARARRWRRGSIAAALLIAVGAVGAGWWRPERASRGPEEPGTLRPLTSYPGREQDVSLSPDGDSIAFVWAEDGEQGNVFVRRIDGDVPIRVSDHQEAEAHPVFSPDGRQLAYARYGDDATWILVASVAERNGEREVSRLAAQKVYGLVWSPDGRWLVFAQRPAPGQTIALFRLEIATQFLERLTAPPAGIFGDLDPAWSPDGLELVFVRLGAFGVGDLFALEVAGRTLRRLTDLRETVVRPTWSPDGSRVLFVRRRPGRFGLSWVARAGGEIRDLDFGSDQIVRAAAAPAIGHMVVERLRANTNLWRLDLTASPHPMPWLSSTAQDRLPAFSADSSRVAFVSERSGSTELWVAESNDSHPHRLTSVGTGLVGRPQWSPDGGQIAFDSSAGGNVDIHLVSVDGGVRSRFTDHMAEDCLPSWSRDGESLYFASNRSGRWQVWRQPTAGGAAQQVTQAGGLAASESFDGRWLYYIKPTAVSGLWRQSVDGGEEDLVFADFEPTLDWALTPEGVFYVDQEAADGGAVVYRDLPRGAERTVWQLDRPAKDFGLAVSGDGRFLALALLDSSESDLLLTRW